MRLGRTIRELSSGGVGRRWRFRPVSAALGAGLALSLDHAHLSTTAGAGQDPAPLLQGVPAPASSARGAVQPVLSDKYDFDVVVIGGGSGGLACAREVAAQDGKVVLFDYVVPSPAGTKWGIGGTCVNVGCIPKKLMHQAALLGVGLHDAREYGWDVPPHADVKHSWPHLVRAVHDSIRGTNWGYRNALRDERVEYINASARVVDGHTVEYTVRKGGVTRVSAAHVVVAVGGRPRFPHNVEGAEAHGITSDDLFWLPSAPGKTLLVGAGYVALECAGFLNEIGCPATVMARGPALRGFDQDIASRIVGHMAATGVRFLRDSAPVKLEQVQGPPGGKAHVVRVTWRTTGGEGQHPDGTHTEDFDTVVFATGRAAETARLGLDKAGVSLDSSGKVIGGLGQLKPGLPGMTAASSTGSRSLVHSVWSETSSVPSIHAVGDVLSGRPELTPVAVRAGKLLAHRLMRGIVPTDVSAEHVAGVDPCAAPLRGSPASKAVMDYALVPTTVFTPIEYGCVGLSEEEAVAVHGRERTDVYHLAYDTLELSLAHRHDKDGVPMGPQCYAKMVTVAEEGEGGGQPVQRVVGLHILGPNAGEVIQGFAVALRMGATREDITSTVGIHPTHAEEVVTLDRNKKDGKPALKTSC